MNREVWPAKADADPGAIDLAHTPSFALGEIEIHPSTREIITASGVQSLEPRPMQVLAALNEAGGRVVSRDDLIRRCWDNRAVSDDAIHRAIGILRALGRETGAFQVETIARVGYRLTSATPSASVIEANAAQASAAAAGVSRRPRFSVFHRLTGDRRPLQALVALVLILGVVGASVVAWSRFAPGAAEPRIAVSAFEPLQTDAQTGSFAKRLTDDVTGVLNENITGLAPPGPEGSAKPADLRVGGSVQREGETLRVRAFLEDGRAKVTLWSRQYERDAAQEDALRTQVAVDLSDNLLNAMEPLQQRGLKIDSRALALWVSATAFHRQGRTMGDPRIAARAYEEVVERAPKFARARGMMAQSLAQASMTAPPSEVAALRQRAQLEAEKAIRTDPLTADGGYDALYWLARRQTPTDFARAEDIWAKALARSPNMTGGLMRRCELLLDLGRSKAALPSCERAAALRPLGAPWGYRYARALAATGQTERAQQAIEREVRLHPQHWWIRQARFQMKAFNGAPAEALALLHDPTQPPAFDRDEVDALEAFLQARASQAPADIDRAVARLRATVDHGGLNRGYLFKALVALGRLDEAYAWAAPGPENLGSNQGWLFEPGMEPALRDRRFWPLAARIGLIDYWRKRAVWPDFCSQPGAAVDCAAEAARAAPR